MCIVYVCTWTQNPAASKCGPTTVLKSRNCCGWTWAFWNFTLAISIWEGGSLCALEIRVYRCAAHALVCMTSSMLIQRAKQDMITCPQKNIFKTNKWRWQFDTTVNGDYDAYIRVNRVREIKGTIFCMTWTISNGQVKERITQTMTNHSYMQTPYIAKKMGLEEYKNICLQSCFETD